MNKQLIETLLTKLLAEEPCATNDGFDSQGLKHIVILQRGWVVMGNLFKQGDYFRLENGAVIRKWGTDRGLGQIALEGVTKSTILDPVSEMHFHKLTVVGMMKCMK